MEIKENVTSLENQSEQAALPQKNADSRTENQSGSAALGKFKDANALAQAYGALEAEFTRRSQRLKELEKLFAKQSETALKSASGEREKGGETPEKLATSADVEANGEIVAVQPEQELGHGKETADEGNESITISGAFVGEHEQGLGESSSSDGEKADVSVVAPSAESVVPRLSDDELYRIAVQNENVRIKIVGEYLASLKNAGAPLARGGVGAVAISPSKARSLSEAGDMALRFFRAATKE